MEKAKVSGKISISHMVKSTKVRTNVGETLVYQLDKNGGSKRRYDKLRDDVLIENMFSFVEAEINTELEESLLGSYICYSDKMHNAVQLKEMLLSDGLMDARILQISCFTHYVNKGDGVWTAGELQILERYFFQIKKWDESDLINARAVEIECRDLPVIAWREDNLKSFTKDLGVWITWSFQNEDNLEIYDPCITCVTKQAEIINKN